MDSRIARHDEGGKDYNAEAMIIETRNNSGRITATPGWKMKQPRRNWTELLQGTQKLDESGRPQQSYG